MKKTTCAASLLLLFGCTVLDAESSFTDAISRVDSKQNYQIVVGKPLTPVTVDVNGGQLVKSTLALNYIASSELRDVPTSYITMELQYFKNYNEFKTVSFDETESDINLSAYAATAETCSDICTQTQYVKFPVSNSIIEGLPYEDLSFDITASNANSITFMIPGEYIQAIVETKQVNSLHKAQSQEMKNTGEVYKANSEQLSQAVEMSKYWFNEMSVNNKEKALTWAIENRKKLVNGLELSTKEADMFNYWYQKSTPEERKAIISDLL